MPSVVRISELGRRDLLHVEYEVDIMPADLSWKTS